MPSFTFKMEYIRQVYDRYRKALRDEKTEILDEIRRVCGWHRKHAIRVLSAPKPAAKRAPLIRRGRLPVYHSETINVLCDIWKASGYLCGQRLAAALHLWIRWARTRYRLTPEIESQLLSISPRQIDRRLAPYKNRIKKRIYGTTKPGLLLKRMIPIKTDHWDVEKSGFQEIDLVSHSGSSADGQFIHTLNSTDIHTTWVERQAVLGKSEVAVVGGMAKIEQRLPFPLLGIDSDNGSEFINNHLWAFCRKRPGPKIQFTRSRPYKKDDNAHIEQKNWTHVRKLLGYERYDSRQALAALNDLFAELRLFQNLFQPSLKLKEKVRKGSRLIRKYHPPKTPLERVLQCPQADPLKTQELENLRDTLNPFELSHRIEQKLALLYRLATHRPVPRASASAAQPWRSFHFGRRAARRDLLIQNAPRSFIDSKLKNPTKGDKVR